MPAAVFVENCAYSGLTDGASAVNVWNELKMLLFC